MENLRWNATALGCTIESHRLLRVGVRRCFLGSGMVSLIFVDSLACFTCIYIVVVVLF
jgi:hypothetical protein